MERDFLVSLGLSDDVVNQVIAKHGQSTTELRTQLTDSQTQLTNAQNVIVERDADIEALRQSDVSEGLRTQLADLQGKYDNQATEFQTTLIAAKKTAAVELKAVERQAKNNKLAIASLDGLDDLDFNDKDFDTKLNDLFDKSATDNSYLYGVDSQDETPPPTPPIVTGGNPAGAPGSNDDPFDAKLAKYK